MRPAGRLSSSEYCTCIVVSGTPAPSIASMCSAVEIGAAELVDLAGAAQLVEPGGRLQPPRHRIVPPMELHEVQPVEAEPP